MRFYERFYGFCALSIIGKCTTRHVFASFFNKRHAMHAEAMTFHKGPLIIFRTFVKKLGYIKVTDNFCAE